MVRKLKQTSNKILFACIAISCLLHAAGVFAIHRHTFWVHAKNALSSNSSWLSEIDKKEKNQILKETFNQGVADAKSLVKQPEPEASSSEALQTTYLQPSPSELPQYFFHSFFPHTELLASAPTTLPHFSHTPKPLNLLEHLPKELIIPTREQPTSSTRMPMPQINETRLTLTEKSQPLQKTFPPQEIIHAQLPSSSQMLPEKIVVKPPTLFPMSHLPSLPTLVELQTTSYSDAFETEVVFLPREEGSGYIFAITLMPKADLELPRLRQHVTFLIDRSNSIQLDRLGTTKNAVHKALEELLPDDTFNIVVFDNKIEKLSPHSLPCTPASLSLAEAYLEKVELGSFFSTADLYKPLVLTVPGFVEEDEVYTAILLTDAENLAKKTAQKLILHDWTQYNTGKVSLFALGMNGDPGLSLLDVAATFNKGKLLVSPTKRGIKRKLLKLMKTIQTPVAKNLTAKAISPIPQNQVILYPRSVQLSHLYLDQPYVILGTTETLDDFFLFVQGRLKNQWLNIKKPISFINAKKGSHSLKSEWALQRAYTLYEQYMQDGQLQHIQDAKKILEPLDMSVAFK